MKDKSYGQFGITSQERDSHTRDKLRSILILARRLNDARARGKRRAEFLLEKKFLRFPFDPSAVQGHLVDGHYLERDRQMTSALENMMRYFKLSVRLIQYMASMFRCSRTKFLTGFTNVGSRTAHTKEDIDDILCLTIHGLLNDKNDPIFHLNVRSFYDVIAALAVMTCIVAFGHLELFRCHREIRVCQKELQVWRLTTTRDYSCLIHDEFHFWALIKNVHAFQYPRKYVRILRIVCVYKG